MVCINEEEVEHDRAVVRPLAEVPGKVAVEVARGTNWTLVFLVLLGLVGVLYAIKHLVKR